MAAAFCAAERPRPAESQDRNFFRERLVNYQNFTDFFEREDLTSYARECVGSAILVGISNPAIVTDSVYHRARHDSSEFWLSGELFLKTTPLAI